MAKAGASAVLWLALIFSPFVATAQLQIKISGLINMPSRVYVALYDSPENFLTEQRFRSYVLDVQGNDLNWLVKDVPDGQYAVSVYQDLNGNARLDRGVFRQPTEPFGFSKAKHPFFKAPDFQQCAFEIEGAHIISIHLKR
jgi:uncharacterized protein (DUF2141 family)